MINRDGGEVEGVKEDGTGGCVEGSEEDAEEGTFAAGTYQFVVFQGRRGNRIYLPLRPQIPTCSPREIDSETSLSTAGAPGLWLAVTFWISILPLFGQSPLVFGRLSGSSEGVSCENDLILETAPMDVSSKVQN